MNQSLDATVLTPDLDPAAVAATALGHLQLELWHRLERAVDTYSPDIVVLVARKMPRLYELFHLRFPRGALVISDLAIPFCHQYFKGSRVAILDDVINVGTTITYARHRALACGAVETHAFALAGRQPVSGQDIGPVTLSQTRPMDVAEIDHFGSKIPAALGYLPKPYDLDFPIIPCKPGLPLINASDFYRAVSDLWPINIVSEHGHLKPSRNGLTRFSISLAHRFGENSKVRLYTSRSKWHLVPMALRTPLPKPEDYEPRSDLARRFLDQMLSACATSPDLDFLPYEAKTRVALFAASVDLGLDFMYDAVGHLVPCTSEGISIDDAKLNFGPAVENVIREAISPWQQQSHTRRRPPPVSKRSHAQTLLSGPDGKRIVSDVLENIHPSSTTISGLMVRCVEVLAQFVGASDPSKYDLTWPYTAETIRKHQYYRLRVGFTFQDFVDIVSKANLAASIDSLGLGIAEAVSQCLDSLIDSGIIVPAIGVYDGVANRVYRKGESPHRDSVSDRVVYGWLQSKKALSLTRVTKMLAILSYSADVELNVVPMFREFGVAVGYPWSTVDDDSTEITHYLRRTGKLDQVG